MQSPTDFTSQSSSNSPISNPGALRQTLAENQTRPSINARRNSPQSGAPKAILSCELCRTRKIKCDKAEGGCSNCRKAGLKCVALNRQRLPRGRNGGRKKADAELKIRVGRLENLVRTLEAGQGEESENGIDDAVRILLSKGPDVACGTGDKALWEDNKKPPSGASSMNRYLGSSFWSGLTEEINGLREILDDEDEIDDEEGGGDFGTPITQEFSGATPYSFIFAGPTSLVVSPEASQHPPQFMINGLCAIYERRVVPLFNIIWWPGVSNFLLNGQPYLQYPANHPATDALIFAVCLGAVSSQTEEECIRNFGESQSQLAAGFRFKLEAALSRADLLQTKDITVLQAFMLLLLCARVQNNGRFTWSLLALAVRIGHAIGLEQDDEFDLSPFQHEMRRRVWNGLCILDLQAMRDRGSSPLIGTGSFSTPPPLNIPDNELHPGLTTYPDTQEGCFEISINIMSGFAARVCKQLDHVSRSGGQPLEIDQNWDRRQDLAVGWKERFEKNIGQHLDLNDGKHAVVRKIADTIYNGLMLSAVRPLRRHPRTHPPKVSTKYLLELTCPLFETIASGSSMDAFHDWSWFGTMYNQWHALAVMAASLCIETKGPIVDRAWHIVEPSLEYFKKTVADNESGMLWRPIEKLMKRAREVRAQALGAQTTRTKSTEQNVPPAPIRFETRMPQTDLSTLSLEPSQMKPVSMPNSDGNLFGGTMAAMDNSMLPPTGPSWNDFGSGMSDFGTGSTSSESPGASWANWESFIQDLNQNPDALFDMPPMDPAWTDSASGLGPSLT